MGTPEPEADDEEKALELIQSALDEARATVRAYDTKAQIVGVGYAFALGIVAGTSDWFPEGATGDLTPVLVFWGCVMLPLLLFGFVLYPSRRTAPRVEVARQTGLNGILYVNPAAYEGIDSLKEAASRSNRLDEYAYEALRVSNLRELKRTRFIRALITAAFAFGVMFLAQVGWRMAAIAP